VRSSPNINGVDPQYTDDTAPPTSALTPTIAHARPRLNLLGVVDADDVDARAGPAAIDVDASESPHSRRIIIVTTRTRRQSHTSSVERTIDPQSHTTVDGLPFSVTRGW
jgi:hypothetical protein